MAARSLPPALAAGFRATAALQAQVTAWATINSGSDHHAGLARQADELDRACRRLTPDVHRIPIAEDGRVIIHARRRPAAAVRVLCSGHYDTVYGAAHPFQTCTQPDAVTLRGPGVADMKGGLVVLLAALEAFEQLPEANQLGWEILLTPDEETGSSGSRPHLEAAAARVHVGLVFEPARPGGELVHTRKGIGQVTLTARGRAAHAGQDPGAGRNAIAALAELIVQLPRAADALPALQVNVGRIHGGGPLNMVPDLAVAELDLRAADLGSADRWRTRLEALVAEVTRRTDVTVDITGGFSRPPMEATPEGDRLFALLQEVRDGLALPPVARVRAGGGSDANFLQAAGLPCLDGLGPVGGSLHSSDEYIELPSLAERALVAAGLLRRLAQAGPAAWRA